MKRSYYPSGDPEQCKNLYVQRGSHGQILQRLECHAKALFQIGKLRLCYGCFERHLATNDVDLSLVRRLSDNEGDFVEHFAARRGMRKVEACG